MKRWEVNNMFGYSVIELCEIDINRNDKVLEYYCENGKMRRFTFSEWEKRIPHKIADELNKKYGLI